MPFIGLKKEIKNGIIYWKRYERDPLTKDFIAKINSMNPIEIQGKPTEEKRFWLYSKFDEMHKNSGSEPVLLIIDRKNIYRDSYEQFKTVPDFELRKELKIHFIDESAHDAGGLIREWFTELIEFCLGQNFNAFKRANVKELSYVINENFDKNEENYYFIGQIIAKAIYERIPIKAFLNRIVLKELLHKEICYEDLEFYDIDLWKSMNFISSNKITENPYSTLTFSIQDMKEPIDLIQNGSKVEVNEENKNQFVQLFADYHLCLKTQSKTNLLVTGFNSLIPKEFLTILDLSEFEFFLCGDSNIDVEDWRKNTIYKGNFSEKSQVIQWFWKILSEMSIEQKSEFLKFCTGSSRIPVEGFKGLMSNTGKVCKFCIEPKDFISKNSAFIIAHTCFNRIELPLYPNYEMMKENILKMLENNYCSEFSLE